MSTPMLLKSRFFFLKKSRHSFSFCTCCFVHFLNGIVVYGGYCITRQKAIVFICLQWWCNLLKKGWLTFYINMSLAHLVPLGYPSYSPPGIQCKNESQSNLTCCLLSHICPASTTKHERTFLTVEWLEGHRLASGFIRILRDP